MKDTALPLQILCQELHCVICCLEIFLLHDVRMVMHEVGLLLAKISMHTFPEAGFFDKDLKVISPITHNDYLIFITECLQNKIVSSQLTSETICKINDLLKKYGQFFPAQHEKSLVHAHFDPANILVDKINWCLESHRNFRLGVCFFWIYIV